VNDEVLFELLRELGADQIPHSRRTLLEHLIGTADIIRRWTDDENTYKAALFHSSYGTEFFKNAPLKSLTDSVEARKRIMDAIDPAAERLVYVFCVMDRGSLRDAVRSPGPTYSVKWHKDPERTPIKLLEHEFAALVQIVWANHMEQNPQSSTTSAHRKTVEESARFLSKEALRELRAYTASTESLFATDMRGAFELLKDWPDKNFMTHGPVSRLGGLADFSFEDLIALPRRFTKAFTLEGRHIPIEPGQEQEHYDAGHTIYWHSLRAPTIDLWLKALDRNLGLVPGATRVSAFASKKGAGLPAHYDPNDNFVCQAQGTKTWRVSQERVLYPTVGATIGVTPNRVVLAESGGLPSEFPPHETIVMSPGDVMFMPRGQWHDTVTEDESLHFNIQCGLANWKDAVEFALFTSLAMHSPELRAPILRTPNFKRKVQKKLLEAAKAIAERGDGGDNGDELDFDAEAFRQFVIRRKEA
jgi:Cupin superfamily protein